jgi:hypothetical protein
MTLVIDNRQTLQGKGMHALVVGVSDYTYLPDPQPDVDPDTGFGMVRLASPALSAFRVYQWLSGLGGLAQALTLAAPLKTCRLLIAPSALENQREPALANLAVDLPTYRNFAKAANAWRTDLSNRSDDIALFFFAGHGVHSHTESSVLCMVDYAEPGLPELQNCVKVSNLHDGMAATPRRRNMAQTQFYFIDACRNMPEDMKRFAPMPASMALDVELNDGPDKRMTPTYFSAAPGGLAVGRRGQISYFCEALLHSLSQAAENPDDDQRWPITPNALSSGIIRYLTRKLGPAAPDVDLKGVSGNQPLVYLTRPPTVDIDIEVDPANLAGQADIELLDDLGIRAFNCPLDQAMITHSVQAGYYRVRVSSRLLAADYFSRIKFLDQRLIKPWRHIISLVA